MISTAGEAVVVPAFSHGTLCAEHSEVGVLGAGEL
jgi:hypothetical protein